MPTNQTGVDPRLKDILYAKSIGKSKEFIYSHPEYRPGLIVRLRFWYSLWQAKRGLPLAYITHEQEFCSLNFKVTKHTLVPRPDTEIMVEEAVEVLKKNSDSLFIDVGTGSGCVAISVLSKIKKERAGLPTTIAIDLSKKALKIARTNADKYSMNIKFVHGSLLEPILNTNFIVYEKIVITANLPYLTDKQFSSEPSIQHEPRPALVADNTTGLSWYEKLLNQSLSLPCPFVLFLEIDPRQKNEIREMITSLLPSAKIKFKTDLAGRDRLVIITGSSY